MFKTACSCQQQGRTWGVPRPLFTVSEVLSGQRCAANPELDAKRIPRVGYGFLAVPARQKPRCWARGAPAQLYELGGVQPPGPLSFVHILEFLAQKDWSYESTCGCHNREQQTTGFTPKVFREVIWQVSQEPEVMTVNNITVHQKPKLDWV